MEEIIDGKEKNKVVIAKKGLNTIRKILSMILSGLLVVCFLFLLCSAVSSGSESKFSISTYKLVCILSGSMEPAIGMGSLTIVKGVSQDELAVNDIITFMPVESSETLVTHRVIEINRDDNSFATKGDGNNVSDSSPVYYDDVVGKVVLSIPLLGYVINYLKTPYSIVTFIVLLILTGLIRHLIRVSKATDR